MHNFMSKDVEVPWILLKEVESWKSLEYPIMTVSSSGCIHVMCPKGAQHCFQYLQQYMPIQALELLNMALVLPLVMSNQELSNKWYFKLMCVRISDLAQKIRSREAVHRWLGRLAAGPWLNFITYSPWIDVKSPLSFFSVLPRLKLEV